MIAETDKEEELIREPSKQWLDLLHVRQPASNGYTRDANIAALWRA
jgi:hypothetical protein